MKLKITVKYFGSVKDDAGLESETIEVDKVHTVGDVVQTLKVKHEGLVRRKGQILFALNQTYCKENVVLKENDELALFPVVSGG